MKKIILKLSFLTLFLIVGFVLSTPAEAFAYTISGTIKDNSGNLIDGASVEAYNVGESTSTATSTSNASGFYSLTVNEGTYDIKVTPPSISNYGPATAKNYVISSDKIIDFVLVTAGNINFSGHLYGPEGDAIPNQLVRVFKFPGSNSDIIGTSRTDSSGYFSMQIQPGSNHILLIHPLGTSPESKVPLNFFNIAANPISLQVSTVIDITVPAKKVTAHVQDRFGTAVENVSVLVSGGNTSIELPGLGNIGMGGGETSGKTDAWGNVDLWVIPGPNTFVASPPNGANGITTTLPNISISEEQTVNISLTPEPVRISGHLYGAQGDPLPNQRIRIFKHPGSNNDVIGNAFTDSSGFYSIVVPPSNNHIIYIQAFGNDQALKVPLEYNGNGPNFSILENKTVDITVPAKKVTVHVQDKNGNSLPEADVTATGGSAVLPIEGNNPIHFGGAVSSGRTNDAGIVDLWVIEGRNTFIASPQNSSSGISTTISNVTIAQDTDLTIKLKAEPVTLSGHIYGGNGEPVPNQLVRIYNNPNNDTVAATTTDTSGAYSLRVEPGTYGLYIQGLDNNQELEVPKDYNGNAAPFSILENKVLDITLPVKKVTIHVQDNTDLPVENAIVQIQGGNAILAVPNSGNLGFGGTATGQTKANGSVDLWVFSGSNNISISPPSNSAYAHFSLSNVNISNEETKIISLQYNHNSPITTANLSIQKSDLTYSNPTTVTLSAVAEVGYNVENIYYTIDGSDQQTYTSPFIISGVGNHTIEYWSVDNSGVPESHKTKTFTISVNDAPYIEPLSDVTINKNNTYSASGSFNDQDSTSWTATVDYGDIGGAPEELQLNGNTFSLSHFYATPGIYTVTVTVRDNQQATGTTSTTVVVYDPPAVTAFTAGSINEGETYTQSGSFADTDSISWTGTVNYGDGAGTQPLPLNPDKTFQLNHLYKDNGRYTITISIADNQGVIGSYIVRITVNNIPPAVGSISAPVAPVQINTSINATATFIDPGVLDVHTATWNWGDGTSSPGSVTESNGSGSVTGDHTYTTPGIYEVTVSVNDGNIEITSQPYQYIVVISPNTTKVDGGVDFNSPSTASLPNAGKIDFGFRGDYINNVLHGGANLSFGNTNFKATSLDWLVVNGNNVQLQATGTIKHQTGTYRLFISASDLAPKATSEGVDIVRVKLINTANNAVLYDSQVNAANTATPTTTISKGDIEIL